MNRARAVRYDNGDMEKEIAQYDLSQAHAVHFVRNYQNRSVTENGALGLKTSGHSLLDLHFQVSSLRSSTPHYIIYSFIKAFYENRHYAVKWLFYLRDIAEGLGERRSFRICLQYLAKAHTEIAREIMELIPDYGRYDDLLSYLDTPLEAEVCAYIGRLLRENQEAMRAGKPISLLAKWLPSINTSSHKTRTMAAKFCRQLGMTPGKYRKTLSALRAYLDVLEVKLSTSAWDNVDYERVPAKANMKYNEAFLRHDEQRRVDYLYKAFQGEDKINSNGLMPYEIVHKMVGTEYWRSNVIKSNLMCELLWKRLLEDGFQNEWGLEDCIVVADGSGSMYCYASGSNSVTAIEVCHSLAIYFAAQLQGIFRDKVISFSERPQLIDLSQGKGLREKLEILQAYDEAANTDIQAVFRLLLDMAVSHQVPAEQIPKQVLIISDMEFDEATYDYEESEHRGAFDKTLFEAISEEFTQAGYPMPRLIFWNVCGRSNTIPTVKGDQGVCLLSGFSQNAVKVAAHKEIQDPYESLIRMLDAPRYEPVEKALGKLAV